MLLKSQPTTEVAIEFVFKLDSWNAMPGYRSPINNYSTSARWIWDVGYDIIVSFPKSVCGIIVLLKTLPKYRSKWLPGELLNLENKLRQGVMGHLSLLCVTHDIVNTYFFFFDILCASSTVWEALGVISDFSLFFFIWDFIRLFFIFFFCQETIYRKVTFVFPFLVLKKSSGAFNHSFLSIAFEVTISNR